MDGRRRRHEAGFLISEEEPRTLTEIIGAEQEAFGNIWYMRSIACDDGTRKLPSIAARG